MTGDNQPATPDASAPAPDPGDAAALAIIVAQFECQAGTVHRMVDGVLRLSAALNLPPHIVELVRLVPVGKGLAGQAAQTGVPVSLCNLQTDQSGAAKPAARSTGLEVLIQRFLCQQGVGDVNEGGLTISQVGQGGASIVSVVPTASQHENRVPGTREFHQPLREEFPDDFDHLSRSDARRPTGVLPVTHLGHGYDGYRHTAISGLVSSGVKREKTDLKLTSFCP